MNFTDKELAILRVVQGTLPMDTLTPFADIAKETGTTEEEVIALLNRLKEDGVIRRFGASLRHQKTQWTHNIMVAWKVTDDKMDSAGKTASEHPNVSHCYYRPSVIPDFPYTLYTMIHGRNDKECADTVAALQKIDGMGDHIELPTVAELKKSSPVYF